MRGPRGRSGLRTDSERAGQEAVVIIQVGKDKGRQSGSGWGEVEGL